MSLSAGMESNVNTLSGLSIELALIAHTNAGKTTLARTLLGRDIGEVRDAAHVTEIAEPHVMIESTEGDVLRLWDTPGFGDSVRLVKRLKLEDSALGNPVGWFLRELWDRHRDRPFWCSQQAMRAARESADVVLYLVNAAENPRDAGYIAPEMQILRWLGKPVVVLLNQVGPPRSPEDEQLEEDRWRIHLETFGVVRKVMTLDAFARCWVQERVLLDALATYLPSAKQPAYGRLRDAWQARSTERFQQAMHALAEQVAHGINDREAVEQPRAKATAIRVLQSFGVGRSGDDASRERAMRTLAERLDANIRATTDRMIALHSLEGHASAKVLERISAQFSVTERLDEGKAAVWGGVLSGALLGLKADLAAGGLTFGAGMLAGGVIGALGGAGLARGYNMVKGADHPAVAWSEEFIAGMVRSSVLRYLAVAHFGRGRGKYEEGEAPRLWIERVETAYPAHAATIAALIEALRAPAERVDREQVVHDLEAEISGLTIDVLERLYPGAMSPVVRTALDSAPSG